MSAEDRQTAQNVVETIRAIYDVRRPNSERIDFNRKIEEFKENGDPRSMFQVAQLITSSPENDEIVYHAGWAFLEHLIVSKWLSIDDGLRTEIQGVCFQVLSSGQPLQCNLSLKTAISRCFVGIMQHEWPQNSNVFDGLEQIVIASPEECFGQIEVVYLVVRRLIENVISMISITDQARRRHLSITLASIMPKFVMNTVNRLKACMYSPNPQYAATIAKSALAAVREIVECGTARWFAECLEPLVDLLCIYLKHPDGSIAGLATRCLETLVTRKSADDGEKIVELILRDSSMQAILDNASLAMESSKNDPDCYEYLKAIVDLLVGLGTKLSHVFEANKEPQNFVLYVLAVSVFFAHPSTYIRMEATKSLTAIFHNEVLRNREDFLQILQERVLPILKDAFRQGFNLGDIAKDNPYDDHDYDDENEAQRVRNSLKTTLIAFFRFLLQNARLHQQINEIIGVWMKECRQFGEETIVDECDVLARVIRFAAETPNEEMRTFYSGLFSHYLAELQKIPKATGNRKQIILNTAFLNALIPVMGLAEVPVFLSEISQILKLPYEGKDTFELKRFSIAMLLRMVKCMKKDDLLQIAEPVLNLAQEYMACVSPLQQGQLLQVTACLSNLIPSMETRVKFLGGAAAPVTAFFCSEKIMKCVSSLQSFMEYSGFSSQGVMCDPTTSTSDDEHIQNRVQLRAYLVAFEGLLQNVEKPIDCSNPLFVHLRPAIPVIFALARCVRNLDKPEALNYLHPSFDRDVLAVSKVEKEQALCSLLETMDYVNNQQEDDTQQQSQKVDDNHWNALARTYSYLMNCHVQSLLGYFAEKLGDDFFAIENLKEILDSTVEELSTIPEIRLTNWFRNSWRLIYTLCPEQAIQSAGPSFVVLQEYTRNLIEDRWAALKANSSASNEEETYAEHITCEVQREFVSFLKDVLVKSDKLTFWLNDKAFCDSILLTLLGLILHDDSQSCHRALSIVLKIVREKYISNVFPCDEQSTVFILRCAMQAYRVHGKDELMDTPLLTLICEIYTNYSGRFQQMVTMIMEAVSASPEDMEKFHRKLSSAKNDKARRTLIKDLFQVLVKPNTPVLHNRRRTLRTQPSVQSTPKGEVQQDLSAVADLFGSGW